MKTYFILLIAPLAQKQEAQGPNCPPAKPVQINKHIYDYGISKH